ncbi:aryl-sulfate sulfotransferase [Companilactobacillus mishanensis]|uniref:aryl-sulfate sulfotransferase n=1 Tax=Companilactobacillus mishanensis TaxID=2486008 RepID=UPI0013DE559C|nr:aryl-sulfate sulfotransferase [Companilactobacillus mishanensis]
MRKKLPLLIVLIGTLFVALTACSNSKSSESTSSTKLLTTAQIKKNIGSKLIFTRENSQKDTNAEYQEIVAEGNHSLDDPYIKVNPYGTSPLSALVIFDTMQEAKISYTVQGESKDTSISNAVNSDYSMTHQVPVVGLYSDKTNKVTLDIEYKDGTTASKEITVKTGKLPKYVREAKIKIDKNDKSKMDIGDNGLTLIDRTTKEPFAIDADGKVRWYSTNYSQHTVEELSSGHILILTKKNVNASVYNDLIETDYLGRIYKEYSFSDKTKSSDSANNSKNEETTLIHHDILELPNGNLLATVSDGSEYKEDVMAEISSETGKVVKVIDLKKLMPTKMYSTFKKGSDGKNDWFHQNSIEYDTNDDSILISGRDQDMIMKIDYKTSEIKWIFSGKKKSSWPKKYQDKILTPTKGTSIIGGQHALTLLQDVDGNPDSESILLYNNNENVTNGDKKTSGKYSQAVQYHVDPKKMTIDETWSYGKKLGKKNFTYIIGYAQRLSNDNTLIDFGYKNEGKESNIIEVNKEGKEVFDVTVANSASKAYAYRAYRMNFYSDAYTFDVLEANEDM